MTIKEAEVRTGLARANIRYYEDQGFFTPARGENGYRDYSEEDISTLLKLKLLRQLGFSLEEIRDFQRGDQTLEAALLRREEGLDRERQELDQAARLCREIRNDGADFYTLDARRYLDQLAREEVLSKDQSWDPARIFPLRRAFARGLDMMIWSSALTFVLQLTLRLNYTRTSSAMGGSLLLDLGGLLLMAGAEVLFLHFFGATPGKALLGLRIIREDGSYLSLNEAVARTTKVMAFYGATQLLGDIKFLLVQLVGLAMMIWACWTAYHGRSLPWESQDQLYLDGSTRERGFWEIGKNYLRLPAYAAVAVACVGLTTFGHSQASLPLHRGAYTTVEEFVENYNQYEAFVHGRGNLSRQLTVSGQFEDIPGEEGGVVINILENEQMPQASFRFSEKDGALCQVTLSRKYESEDPLNENQSYFVSIPYEEIYAAMRSYLYGRLGGEEIDSDYNGLVRAQGNYHSEVLNGVKIDSEMRFTGYNNFDDGTLVAENGQRQSYFVEFTMTIEG